MKDGEIMQTGEDLVNIIGRIASDLFVESIRTVKSFLGISLKLTGKASYEGLKTLLERYKNVAPGKNNLSKLMKSGEGLKMTDINHEDFKFFAKKAKKFGLCFAIVKDGANRHLVYKEGDIEKVQKILDISNSEKEKFHARNKELQMEKEKDKLFKEDKKLAKMNEKGYFTKVPTELKERVILTEKVTPKIEPEKIEPSLKKLSVKKLKETQLAIDKAAKTDTTKKIKKIRLKRDTFKLIRTNKIEPDLKTLAIKKSKEIQSFRFETNKTGIRKTLKEINLNKLAVNIIKTKSIVKGKER